MIGLREPPKTKVSKKSGIVIKNYRNPLRKLEELAIILVDGISRKSRDRGIMMFQRPPKTKSSRKTLNFGPKIIEIGPGSSENELCKDHDLSCNFLIIFSKS